MILAYSLACTLKAFFLCLPPDAPPWLAKNTTVLDRDDEHTRLTLERSLDRIIPDSIFSLRMGAFSLARS